MERPDDNKPATTNDLLLMILASRAEFRCLEEIVLNQLSSEQSPSISSYREMKKNHLDKIFATFSDIDPTSAARVKGLFDTIEPKNPPTQQDGP